jgi:hypothetical protein
MEIANYEILFSRIRLEKYISACGKDVPKGIELYKYNIQLSQALYPIISILEVALRNCIDNQLTIYFNDKNWLINNRKEFANHPALLHKNKQGIIVPDNFFNERLKSVESKLRFRGIPISHNKLISELTFGFWVKFFDKKAIKILNGSPLFALKNRGSMKSADIHSHLNSIVLLRNRISHNEPICFDNNGMLSLKTIRKYETNILQAIDWIDYDLGTWAKKLNFFSPVYIRISKL